MNILVRVALVFAAVGIMATTTGAALAPSTAPAARGTSTITGEGWSGPAQPVTCDYFVPRASCTPNDPAIATAERCFSDVEYSGGKKITVCTTHEGSIPAIQRVGGEELTLSFDCGFIDQICQNMEAISRGLGSITMGGLSWAFSNTSFSTDSYLWDSAISEWAWWQGAVLLIILLAGIWGITEGLIRQDRGESLTAFLRLCLAFPVSVGSVWLIGNLIDVVDGMVIPLLQRGQGGEGLTVMIQNMIYGAGGGNYFVAPFTLVLLTIGVLVLVLVFSFRNFALAALIAIGPVAYMLFPTRVGRTWITNYWAAVIALLLTTPLTIGLLMLILKGVGEVESLWSIQAFPLGVGLIMVAIAPMAAFSLFSFAGQAAGDAVGSRMGGTATNTARSAGRVGSIAQRSAATRSRAQSTSTSRTGTKPPAKPPVSGPTSPSAGPSTPTPQTPQPTPPRPSGPPSRGTH